MLQRKYVMIISALLVVATLTSVTILEPFTSNNSSSAVASLTSADIYPTTLIEESHLIEDVPYVSQETDFFCSYASITMMFQYFGIDTTLHEILYYSGVGFSQVHQSLQPIAGGGYTISQLDNDMYFLSTLYGLSFNSWSPNSNVLSDDEYWHQYWSNIKQNISNNIPIITSVDPFILPSIRKQFDVSNEIWDSFSAGGHGIVVLGYNETNGTVCYNDPAAELYGNANYGTYAWMSLVDFREAVSSTTATKYLIYMFDNISNPLPKQEAFELAHERNIERLKGNISAYDSLLSKRDDLEFGIYASKALKDDFRMGIKHRLRTISLYKYIGMQSRRTNRWLILSSFRFKFTTDFLEFLHPSETEYDIIAIEKQYAANYLRSIDGAGDYNPEVSLLEREAEHWSRLSSYYNIFLKRGFFLSLPRAILIMKNMENTVDNIISIEENIIK